MRFFRRGITAVVLVPTIAASTGGVVGSPTRAELDAGEDLSEDVADITGWQLTNSPIATPNLRDKFTGQIEGEDTIGDSSLTLYDRTPENTMRASLAKGTQAFLVILPYGDVPARRCQIYPVTVTGVNDEYSIGNDPARFVTGFAITAPPNLNGTVPATGP